MYRTSRVDYHTWNSPPCPEAEPSPEPHRRASSIRFLSLPSSRIEYVAKSLLQSSRPTLRDGARDGEQLWNRSSGL